MPANQKVMEPLQWDMRVRSITKVERQKEDSDTTKYRLVARDKDGVNEIIVESGSPFKGISAKDGVIKVSIKNSQVSIDHFDEKKEVPEVKEEKR